MLEAGVALTTAAITGVGVLTQRLHNRINELDKRLDGVELRIAQQYVSKADLADILTRVEDHMVRIETKLDRIVMNHPPRYDGRHS